MKTIVLTGGPCGGKSTLLKNLRDRHLFNFIEVPEAALLLIQGGVDGRQLCVSGKIEAAKTFQKAVVELQMHHENVCSKLSKDYGELLLCHRGMLDPLAFWLFNGWPQDEFYEYIGMDHQSICNRYSCVLHLQSTAIDAESFYERNAGSYFRKEDIADAVRIDSLCAKAWSGHPAYRLISNNGINGWSEKLERAVHILTKEILLTGD